MGLVRTHYNPYRTKIKKAAEGMVISSENAINENPNVEEEEKSKKEKTQSCKKEIRGFYL